MKGRVSDPKLGSTRKTRERPAKGDWTDDGFSGGGGGSFAGGGASGSWDAPEPKRDAAPVAAESKPTARRHDAAVARLASADRWTRTIRNGYAFRVDSIPRTREVEGELRLATKPTRSKANQEHTGGADRRSTDEGGHYIAARFGGPHDSFNHFAQDRNFNRSEYKALENAWARSLGQGKRVRVHIMSQYVGASQRPVRIIAGWTTDGRYSEKEFANEARSKHRGAR